MNILHNKHLSGIIYSRIEGVRMKVIELFSGIGSQAKALEKLTTNKGMIFEVSNTCEWNIHAIVAYHFIHNKKDLRDDVKSMTKLDLYRRLSSLSLSSDGKEKINDKYLKSLNEDLMRIILSAILDNNNLIDIRSVKGQDIPDDIDLMTYSFPCQDLSNVGSFHGYTNGIDKDKNTRSGLLWEVERILIERKNFNLKLPQFLLLENVTSLQAVRHNTNFKQWQDQLEKLGYINKIYKLNSKHFGMPQNRNRLLMLSVYIGENELLKNKIISYWDKYDLNRLEILEDMEIKKNNLSKFLKIDYKNSTYYLEALEAQPKATPSRLKIWENNSIILDENGKMSEWVQTITTKQDRHPNSGNIYFSPPNNKSRYRFLTPRECFLLMGFDENDFNALVSKNLYVRKGSKFFSRDVLYKLAGNSIVVDVLERVFEQMFEVRDIINHYSEGKETVG